MIGRIYDPEATTAPGEPQPVQHVALKPIDGIWKPIRMPVDGQTDRWAAARIAALHLRTAYQRIEQDARILRVVFSSGALALKGPLIDAELVQRQVIELQSAITNVWPVVDYLLAEPGALDTVHIEGAPMHFDESGVLVGDKSATRPLSAVADAAEDELPTLWPRRPLIKLTRAFIEARESQTGKRIDIKELREAAAFLKRLIAERAEAATGSP